MADGNTLTLFPVGNGDMFLFQVGERGNGKTILIDMNIRDSVADNELDALTELHKHLPKNKSGAPYLDLLIVTHPDKDHVNGFSRHFHTGQPKNWQDVEDGYPKIVSNEIWFSEICTKRISRDRRLTDCAKSLRKELKRRRQMFEDEANGYDDNGNRLRVIGLEEEQQDTSENWYLPGLVYKRHKTVNFGEAEAYILAPFGDSFYSEANSSEKNESSIIIRWKISGSEILLGGDATQAIWENVNKENEDNTEQLTYDILVAPHHCSWGVLGTGSKSQNIPYKLNEAAKSALSHCQAGAYIVASSRKFGDQTPPHSEAKSEYLDILEKGSSSEKNFVLLSDGQTDTSSPQVTTFTLSKNGVVKGGGSLSSAGATASGITTQSKPIKHA